MKRLCSSDSLAALMSTCPSEELSPRSTHVYSREFQSVLDGLDEEGCSEESGHIAGKKRRLRVEQVKALEKNFEVENKLEPERKVKLAQDLGLQPRQVAVWFQNRRARWKTKQLERDYGVLKASYDSLRLNCDSLQRDNDALAREIKELNVKLNEENREMNPLMIKEEAVISDTENKDLIETSVDTPIDTTSDYKEVDYDDGILIFQDLKDGSSDDSDSSAVLNEDNSPKSHQLVMSPTSSSFRLNCSSHSSLNCNQFSDSSNAHKAYEPQLVKLEEHNLFSGEDACDFFSDEQAPSLHWYGPEPHHHPHQWN